MKSISNYKDLCIEIDIQKYRVQEIEKEIKQLKKLLEGPKELKGIDYSQQPGGKPIHIPFDKIYDRLVRLENKLENEKQILKNKIKTKKQIDDRLKNLTGIKYKVAYLRCIEGKKINEIADELGYTYQYIRLIAAKINNNSTDS